MVESVFVIECEDGLHGKAAALFVQVTSKFNSVILMEKDSKKVNAKSIMGVMALGVMKGDEIRIQIEGIDEKEAMIAMEHLVKSNFTSVPPISKNK